MPEPHESTDLFDEFKKRLGEDSHFESIASLETVVFEGLDRPSGSIRLAANSELSEWKKKHVIPHGPNVVFLDTTTIASALEILTPPHTELYAFQLWDLSTVVSSIVLFDRVLVCRGNGPANVPFVNEALGEEVVCILPTMDKISAVAGAMESMWLGTRDFMWALDVYRQFPEERKRYYEIWRDFLGISTDAFALIDSNVLDSYSSSGPRLLGQITRELNLDKMVAVRNLSDWKLIVAESCMREEFNTRFSYFIGVPYLANSFRAPNRRLRYLRAGQISDFLRSSSVLQSIYEAEAKKYPAADDHLTLPFFLTALFSRMEKLDEFWEQLADMRYRARGYRARRQELDAACLSGNLRELKVLEKAMRQETTEIAKWATSSFATITGILGVALVAYQPRLGAAALTVQLAFAGMKPWIEKNAPDWFRSVGSSLIAPKAWFLADTAKAAIQLTNALPKIANLWLVKEEKIRGLRQLEVLSRWGIT
jgi:hypothetical protein